MRISIAMCTYNGSLYLEDQLKSISSQTRLPDELIICDDGSTDDTLKIVKRFQIMAPFTVHICVNQINLGSTKNFEKAICHCTGDIIVLADQDDIWVPTKLFKIEKVFKEEPKVGLVFSDADVVDKNLESLGFTLWKSINFNLSEQELISKGYYFKVLLRHNVVTGATMAFKAEYKELTLPFPIDWYHDGWIALIISSFSELKIINTTLIKYRQHGQNQVGSTKKNLLEKIKLAKHLGTKTAIEGLQQYTNAYNHLLTIKSNDSYSVKNFEVEFRDKINHLMARSKMSSGLKSRIFFIFKELINYRYHRYSEGWYSVAKDLFL